MFDSLFCLAANFRIALFRKNLGISGVDNKINVKVRII